MNVNIDQGQLFEKLRQYNNFCITSVKDNLTLKLKS